LQSTDCKLPDDGLVKPKHVGAFIVYFNVNFNILKQIGCALVGLIKDWITIHNNQPVKSVYCENHTKYTNTLKQAMCEIS
jgi:hypothetical protein